MPSALIGSTGFVGSNLLRQTHFDRHFDSRNICDAAGDFDLVVCAAAPAAKWKANLEPETDRENIERLMGDLRRIGAGCFMLISTIDVYARLSGVDEEALIDSSDLHAYGKHRLQLEEFVRSRFANNFVVRLPAVFGPGLKKNFIFDLCHNGRLDLTDFRSEYQFYNVGRLWSDLRKVRNGDVRLLNLVSEPVSAGEIATACAGVQFTNTTATGPVCYNVQTVHAAMFGKTGRYTYSWAEVMPELSAFIAAERRPVT